MTLRERFRRTMAFEDVPLRPNFELGYWDRTLSAWHEQGLPRHIDTESAAFDYFGIERCEMVAVSPSPLPLYTKSVIDEDDTYLLCQDEYGCVFHVKKDTDQSIPHFVRFPVTNRPSWERYEQLLLADEPLRWQYFDASVEKLRSSTAPVGIDCGSLIGTARNLMGFGRIAMLSCEDPEFLKDIVDAFGRCILGVLERALPHIQIDFGLGWEDICFNQGPIVQPGFMRRAVGPWYRRIADLLADHGCTTYATDTDGDVTPIIDVFLDNGLNTLYPVEVNAGTDAPALRLRFGKRVKFWGGVNKHVLLESRKAIDAELERLLPAVEEGGFIPTLDHKCPPNVPLNRYQYYLDRKREVLGVGGAPQYE